MGRAAGHGPPSTLPAPPLPRSYLAIPATSWVDDFLDWLNPTGRCCRIHQFGSLAGQFCPSTSSEWALVLAGGGLLGAGAGALRCLVGGCWVPTVLPIGIPLGAHWASIWFSMGAATVPIGSHHEVHWVPMGSYLVPTKFPLDVHWNASGCPLSSIRILLNSHWDPIDSPLGAH